MSAYVKRSSKPQRSRKKPTGPTNSLKPINNQTPSGTDIGIFANASLTYCLARCFLGNVGEVFTKNQRNFGVIKAIGPNGGFGLKYVRSDDGSFEEDKIIPLTDIKKIVLRNVSINDIQKEETVTEPGNPSMDDPANQLEEFFKPHDDACEYDFPVDDNFSPDAMFALNEEKFNVKSTYPKNMEGYTVQLDKNDPNFKAKEKHFAKIAQEMEGEKDQGSNWDAQAEEGGDNEELRFSAVLQDGVPGRDSKPTLNHHMRGVARTNNRRSVPRDVPIESRVIKSVSVTAASQDHGKTQFVCPPKTKTPPAPVPEKSLIITPSPKPKESPMASKSTTPAPDAENMKTVNECDKKEKKKFMLDPDAPEFKPSGLLPSETGPLPQPVQPPPFTFNAAQYSQAISCHAIPMPAFAVANQHTLQSGGANSVTFSLPSPMPCMIPSTIPPQLTMLRQPGAYPQPITVMPQPLSNQPSSAHSKGPRQNNGNYGRTRPTEPSNQVGQPGPYHVFQPQQFPFVQQNPYSCFPFIPAGNLPSAAYSGIPALANQIPATQASGQPHPPQGQVGQGGPSQQATQQQGPLFHPAYNPQLGSMQGQPLPGAYAHYPGAVQAQPNALGFYAQPTAMYPTHGYIPVVGSSNQPQVPSQVHHQVPLNQQVPPLQLQPGQQPPQPSHPVIQPLQQAASSQQLLLSGPSYFTQPILMPMGVPQQGLQAPLGVPPQNVHGQAQPPQQLYMPPPQQPGGNG